MFLNTQGGSDPLRIIGRIQGRSAFMSENLPADAGPRTGGWNYSSLIYDLIHDEPLKKLASLTFWVLMPFEKMLLMR
jgi:hypothetical protein